MQTQPLPQAGRLAGRLPRILVIDDEAGFTRLMKINLEATGRFLVRVENAPFAAVGSALEFHPDLILMDVMMPGLDGGDLARRFAGHPHLAQIPIVFLTATVRHAEVESRDGLFGGLRFLSKPVAMPELLDCLDHHFAGTAARA